MKFSREKLIVTTLAVSLPSLIMAVSMISYKLVSAGIISNITAIIIVVVSTLFSILSMVLYAIKKN